MVEYRLLAENESVQVASQANALPPLKGNEVTPSGLLLSPRSRPTGLFIIQIIYYSEQNFHDVVLKT